MDAPRTMAKVELRGYTSKDLARFIGVSQTTINKWVKQERFADISRSYDGENLYFLPSTLFISPNGNKYYISEIVAQYENENAFLNTKGELDVAQEQIAYYTKKYNGDYDEKLGVKQNQWTPEEEMDAHAWKFYLEKLNVPRDLS